jgi:V/A-type H+-transporting ATPase subunit C
MNRMDFSQAVIRIKVLEKRLLTRARLERMADASDLEEVLKILGETEYQQHLGNLKRVEDYEQVLAGEMKRVYSLMDELTGETVIKDLLAMKYDYHNMKVLLKEKISGKPLSHLLISYGLRDVAKMKNALLTEDFSELEAPVKEAMMAVLKDYEKTEDPQRIDILLDRYYYAHLGSIAKETGIPLFEEYVRNLVDFANVRTLIRVKKMDKDLKFLEEVLLPGGNLKSETLLYSIHDSLETIMAKLKNEKLSKPILQGLEAFGKTGRLSEYERIADNELMTLNKTSKNIIFGPEPLFSYLHAKEAEIKALRIVMVSKINKLSPETIRERLRDLYV